MATGDPNMELDLRLLRNLISKRRDEIEKSVEGTGYLAKTVIGVGVFLLDNEGDINLLSTKQRATFDRFLKPLLDVTRR
jgi:hypothetical protein